MKVASLPASPAGAMSLRILDDCLALVLVLLAGCGGGGGGTPAEAPASQFHGSEMRISIDGAPYGEYKDFAQPIRLDDEQIVFARTRLSFELILDAPGPSTTCTIGDATMKLSPDGGLSADIQVAYWWS